MTPDFELNEWFVQCVGIDVSKGKFTACLGMSDIKNAQFSEVLEFPNTKQGFNQLVKWARKEGVKSQPIRFLMEPTGVYHEGLAYHLYKIGVPVYIVLANKAHNYAKYNGLKTKTDEVDARLLADLGCTNRTLKQWAPPKPIYRELKQLTRFCSNIKKVRTVLQNQLEAITNTEMPEPTLIKHYEKLIADINKQIAATERKIEQRVQDDEDLSKSVERIAQVKGLGKTTIITIIAETNGFEMIHSRKQLASYAGLDVSAKASGTQDPKHHISKRGNVRIRAALYFPSIVGAHSNPQMEMTYNRINAANPKYKKIGITAIMRKMLLLIYTLWTNGEEYDPNKQNNVIKKEVAEKIEQPHEIDLV